MNRIPLQSLNDYLTQENYVLIVGLGFDQRCLSILRSFPKNKVERYIGIINGAWKAINKNNIDEFKLVTDGSPLIIGEESLSIINIADEVNCFLANLSDQEKQCLAIDVTSFSHELLVILIGILRKNELLNKAILLYLGASKYSFNTQEEAVWLSRGIVSIRSILGFPGIMLPSKKLHLIVLVGFEVERAKEVIVQYEPTSLSIGLGNRDESVSDTLHDTNKFFFDKLSLFVNEQIPYNLDVQHFEFSCIDPHKTKDKLLEHIATINNRLDKNIVICPLNTKLSTVGASLAALQSPEIQICYAEPEEYNIDGYCIPGNEVAIIKITE